MKKRNFDDILYDVNFYLFRLERTRKNNPDILSEKHINHAGYLQFLLSIYYFGNKELQEEAKNALKSWDGPGNSYYPIYGEKRKIIGVTREKDIYPEMVEEFELYYSGLNDDLKKFGRLPANCSKKTKNSDYVIVGDTERFDDCLICVAGKSKESAEETLNRMMTNPTENGKKLMDGHRNLRIKEVPAEKCWWRNV